MESFVSLNLTNNIVLIVCVALSALGVISK